MEDNSNKINEIMERLRAYFIGIRDRFGWAPPSEKMIPEGLEQLWGRGVIDLVDFYFLLSAYCGETPRITALLVNFNQREETGRERLERARNKVREYLREIPELGPVS